ncbi:hypothetical protein ABW19_dt0200427 [Dactylella cylindrospora]|nr:hypothetical protein ABW19_dt0200427 [Dactylella cylindrospora]
MGSQRRCSSGLPSQNRQSHILLYLRSRSDSQSDTWSPLLHLGPPACSVDCSPDWLTSQNKDERSTIHEDRLEDENNAQFPSQSSSSAQSSDSGFDLRLPYKEKLVATGFATFTKLSEGSTKILTEDTTSQYVQFEKAIKISWQKLQAEAQRSTRSSAFRRFTSSLQNHSFIIDKGCRAIIGFLDKDPPQNLLDLCTMLLVSHAMSQSLSESTLAMSDTQFRESAAQWKGYLPNISDTGVREQDLFEELLEAMWPEIKEGLEFAYELFNRIRAETESGQMSDQMPNFDYVQGSMCEIDDPGGGISSCSFFGDPILDFLSKDFRSVRSDDLWPCGDDLGSYLCFERNEDVAISGCKLGGLDPISAVAPATSILEPPEQPILEVPSWESLYKGSVVNAILQFFQEFSSASTTFVYVCSAICVSLFGAFSAGPKLNVLQRQDILDSLTRKINCNNYPQASSVVAAVRTPFLNGMIQTLHDLERCVIKLLKIYGLKRHVFEHFLSVIVSHFKYYYHEHLPDVLKCASDAYCSDSYIRARVDEELSGFPTPELALDLATNFGKLVLPSAVPRGTSPGVLLPCKRSSIKTMPEEVGLGDSTRIKKTKIGSTKTSAAGLKIFEYKGPGCKRKSVLKTLPKAPRDVNIKP